MGQVANQTLKVLLVCFLLTGCFSRFGAFSRAESFFLRGDCEKAAKHFSRLSKLNLKEQEFALKAAQTCEEKKNYFPAVYFYEVLFPEVKEEKALKIKKIIAEIYFYKIKNHEGALKYYSAVLEQTEGTRDKFEAGYHISESFYRLKKSSQALLEINKILALRASLKNREKAILLKSSILMSLKDYEVAVPFFREQMEKYPEREAFFRQYLAVIFENQAKILSAIKELEKIKPSNSFLEKKIKELYKRLENQPGSSF